MRNNRFRFKWFKYKKNLILDCGNSGTLGRLILGLLVHSKSKIKITGDKSLSKRDFTRITEPLKSLEQSSKLIQANFHIIEGTNKAVPIKYNENKGSAQCKK